MDRHASLVRRDAAVLVVVDIQERLASAMPRRDAVVATAVLLARAADVLGIPVVLTRQYPRGLGDTVAELLWAEGTEGAVDKTTFDCLREPGFVTRLEKTGRRQVVLAGMETHICVAQTALSLVGAGYDVHVVADAVCSRRDTDRDTALARLRAAGATVSVAESVLYEALGEAGTPEFKAVLDLVKAQPLE